MLSGKFVKFQTRLSNAKTNSIASRTISQNTKTPASTRFGLMSGARNSRGTITVCGEVDGRNGNGAYVGMRPYVGVLMGTPASPDFVVVGIGASERERAEVASICRESGVAQAG